MHPSSIAAIALMTTLTVTAAGVTLDPGATAIPNAMAFPAPGEVSLLEGVGAAPLFYPGQSGVGGTTYAVYLNPSSGGITFSFSMDLSTALPLTRVTLAGYQGLLVDAGYGDTSTFAPPRVARDDTGNLVSFLFDGTPAPPQGATFSRITLVLRTDATAFQREVAALEFVDATLPGGRLVYTMPAAAPQGSTVPELSTLSGLALGVGALAMRRCR